MAISPFFLSSIKKTYAIATPITPNIASIISGVFSIGIKHSYTMFNTLIANAAAEMLLNFPPNDRTVIPKINRSNIQSAKLVIWSSKKSGSRRTFGAICSSQRNSIRRVSKTIRHK